MKSGRGVCFVTGGENKKTKSGSKKDLETNEHNIYCKRRVALSRIETSEDRQLEFIEIDSVRLLTANLTMTGGADCPHPHEIVTHIDPPGKTKENEYEYQRK